jgi:hypothetical protein
MIERFYLLLDSLIALLQPEIGIRPDTFNGSAGDSGGSAIRRIDNVELQARTATVDGEDSRLQSKHR